MSKPAFVYILSNVRNTVLYVGVTSNLKNRILEHKEGKFPGFTKRYHVHKLVYFEELASPEEAILREKQFKGGSREAKIALINSTNPNWNDLFFDLEDI